MNNFFIHESDMKNAFSAYKSGYKYYITLIVVVVLFFSLVTLYKKLSRENKRKFMRFLAFTLPLIEISRQIWLLSSGHYDITRDLPFQMCRMMLVLYSVTILTNNNKLKTICYSIGMPGAALAFVFPNVVIYPALSYEYLRYMLAHLLLAAVPIMWIAGDGFRPKIPDLKLIYAVVFAVAVFHFSLNTVLGSNYLYLNELPEHVNIYLPQPWYTLAIFAFFNAIVTIAMLPFAVDKLSKNT